jgi:CRP/FNR family cyclic AMP-dependent transcriptional regulator
MKVSLVKLIPIFSLKLGVDLPWLRAHKHAAPSNTDYPLRYAAFTSYSLNEVRLAGRLTTREKTMRERKPDFTATKFLAEDGRGRRLVTYGKNAVVFAQGDPANAVFYIQKGKVKLTVVSKAGKEAVIAVLGTGDFFGEGCLTAQQLRMATATAISDCSIMRLTRVRVMEVLRQEPTFSERLLSYMLNRTIRIEEDLVDQLFNSSEKRLARALLLLANFGKEGKPEQVIPKISQETLAEMIGTTRSRVSFFMNKFRKLGFIEYNGTLHVHSSLLNVVLHD